MKVRKKYRTQRTTRNSKFRCLCNWLLDTGLASIILAGFCPLLPFFAVRHKGA